MPYFFSAQTIATWFFLSCGVTTEMPDGTMLDTLTYHSPTSLGVNEPSKEKLKMAAYDPLRMGHLAPVNAIPAF